MLPLPADIFTEPEDVSPDGLADLGSLRGLAGSWQTDKGADVNPKAEGPERRTFIERIRMDPIDPQAAKRGDTACGICSIDFLEQGLRTESYCCDISFYKGGSWTYLIQTELFVRGASFIHRDIKDAQARRPAKAQPAGGDRERSRRGRWAGGLRFGDSHEALCRLSHAFEP